MNDLRSSALLAALALVAPVAVAQPVLDGVAVPCGVAPTRVIAAELDGQPGLDLAIASDAAGAFSILRNLGDGTFGEPVVFVVGDAGADFTICAGDLDGDLDSDLVIAHGVTVQEFVNDGAAGFAPGQTFPTTGLWVERALCAVDIDGDEDVDVIWSNPIMGGGLWLALNEGGGSFAAPVELFHSFVDDPVVAHLDGDDVLDVAFHRRGRREVAVLRGLGGGAFAPADIYPVPVIDATASLDAADLDGDGDLDLITIGTSYGESVWKLTNLGDGTFGEIAAIAQPLSWWGIEVIAPDLDGSGCGDPVPLCEEPWHELFTNDCLGGYTWYGFAPFVEAVDVMAADLDSDGDLDLVYATPGVESILVHGNPRLSPIAVPPVAAGLRIESLHPNPFNPRTVVAFATPAAGHVRVEVFDLGGRRVATPLDRWLDAGRHEVAWDAGGLPSGGYLVRLTAAGRTETGRMTLLK